MADSDAAMSTSLFYLAIFAAAALYLGWRRSGLERRKKQSWESLIGRLKDCNGRALSPQFLWKEGLSTGPEETWERLGGMRGLWSLYSNARVMMEMAEFASQQSEDVEEELLETLRCNAMQIRVCVMPIMAQCVLNHVNESARMQAFRAASVYTGMAARTAELLRNHAMKELPQFVAAM